MIKFYISLTTCMLFLLCSCSSHKNRLVDRTHTDTLSVVQSNAKVSEIRNPYYNVNLQLDLFQNNISFYGTNQTEHWKLFIKEDTSFTFELDGKKTIFAFSKESQEGLGVKYYSKKVLAISDTSQQKTSITILLSKQVAPDWSSVSYLPFSVLITITNQETSTSYSGGGFYISNPTLNDIWVLDSLNNKKVDTAQFSQGFPRLEFHLAGGKVYGYSGCNELSGTYCIVKNEIELNPLISTMKFCMKTSGEASFLEFLNKNRFEYRIRNLRLTLQHRDKTVAVFKKVD